MNAVSTARWYSIGRLLAFVYAAGWFAGTWIFTLVSFAIISPQPPDAADRAAHYAYERAVYPQLYLAVVCIVLAMLCSGGVREVGGLPQNPTGQATAHTTGTSISGQPLWRGTDASALIESSANWLQRAFLLLAGLGTYWSSSLALEQGSFPRGWARLGFVLAALYWLGLLSLLARDGALPVPDAVGGLLILLSGGIAAPIWAAWLALRLPRTI